MTRDRVKISQKIVFTCLLLISAICGLRAQVASASPAMSLRESNALPHVGVLLLLPGQETTGKSADGLAAYFSKSFDNAIGDEDSYKMTNPDENIGILRNGKTLCIEGRKPVTSSDTLPLKMWKLCHKQYTFKIDAANLSGIDLYLQDSYSHLDIKLNNDGTTLVPFTINDDAASVAPDRFRVFLQNASNLPSISYNTLPVELKEIKVYEKNKGIEIAWTAENESNMDRYEIEQSSDAHLFVTAGAVQAKNNAGVASAYSWYDGSQAGGNRYYRIKSFDKSGDIKYSPVVNIQTKNATGRIAVSANPGLGNSITVFFKNSAKGNYQLRLINYAGQTFYNGNISHAGGFANQQLKTSHALPTGIYQMLVSHNDTRENISVFIQ